MLSRPVYGWSTLAVGDYTANISYLVDIPVTWSKALENAVRSETPAVLYADLEGREIYIVLDTSFAAVITDDGDLAVQPIRTDLKTFASDFVGDMWRHFDHWVKWNPDTEFMADLDGRRQTIRTAVDALSQALSKTPDTV